MNIGNLEIGVCDDSPEDLKRIESSLRRGTEKLGERNLSLYFVVRQIRCTSSMQIRCT